MITTAAGLLIAIIAVFALSLWLNRGAPEEASFVGTDSAATEHIEESHPGYTPWFTSVFTPGSGEIESGLFALQAAIGAGIFGFTVGALWYRHRLNGQIVQLSGESANTRVQR
ncbi:energy-coupling factor ABC transporter substrate-binding protein [Gordonia hydrophobica]|uniref:Cobalt transport protein CbiN n=1 Tax=Gordonia hydrophobica TaxID=40516 RepID=A0ABZ2U4Y3_9ACTN|nr:energy-coupling factor ABC transporter substrate-binding protein [Gordonia hydrophobica]MBM7368613.1 cobalt/nickel transport protein [Gordonia hydrophobica]